MKPEQPISLHHLTTEGRNPNSAEIDSMSAIDIVRLINAEDARIAAAVERESAEIAAAIDVIADRFQIGGRLIYMGAGTSGRLGVLDASECPPTFSTDPSMVVGLIAGGPTALTRAVEGAEDHAGDGRKDLEGISLCPSDVVVGIATSGRTPYVIGGLEYASQIGAFTIGFSCNAESGLREHSQIMIAPIVGPEVISGSTRMKAGTATKMVLNMLTTGAMVRVGKSYGNLMVDLRATNHKLSIRSKRILVEMTGIASDEAESVLNECGGELKTAIVAQGCKLTADEARRRLREAGGHLRRALDQSSRPGSIDVPRINRREWEDRS